MNRVYLRKDIVRAIAKNSGFSQAVCAEVLEGYHKLLVDVVENGDRLEDYGYITVSSVYVPQHNKYDPRDNKTKVTVKPKFKVKASIGKTLKDASKKAIDNIDK